MTKVLPYLVAVLLAVASYFAGGSVEKSAGIVLDKDKAVAACQDLVTGKGETLVVKEGEEATVE